MYDVHFHKKNPLKLWYAEKSFDFSLSKEAREQFGLRNSIEF